MERHRAWGGASAPHSLIKHRRPPGVKDATENQQVQPSRSCVVCVLLQPQGGGASVPGGQAEVGAGPGWGLESESQTPKCVKRLLPPRKGFTKALLRSLKFKQ